jgi:hypothetical protein
MAFISTDLHKQNVSIFILSITAAFRLVFCQIHVMLSKMDTVHLSGHILVTGAAYFSAAVLLPVGKIHFTIFDLIRISTPEGIQQQPDICISAPNFPISGFPQLPSAVENPGQVIYDKMDFSDSPSSPVEI